MLSFLVLKHFRTLLNCVDLDECRRDNKWEVIPMRIPHLMTNKLSCNSSSGQCIVNPCKLGIFMRVLLIILASLWTGFTMSHSRYRSLWVGWGCMILYARAFRIYLCPEPELTCQSRDHPKGQIILMSDLDFRQPPLLSMKHVFTSGASVPTEATETHVNLFPISFLIHWYFAASLHTT